MVSCWWDKAEKSIESARREITFTEHMNALGVRAIASVGNEKGECSMESFRLLNENLYLAEDMKDTKKLLTLFEAIFNSNDECIVVIDEKARIVLINRAYCEFLKVNHEDVLGKNVNEVIENTRLDVVLQTGEAETNQLQQIKGHDAVCSRIPLKNDGETWAAVGMVKFKNISELSSLMKKIERLQVELIYYKDELKQLWGTQYTLGNIISSSYKMKKLKELLQQVAKSDSTVLIRGESGTGKELFAHALHNASHRDHRPFVKVNCAALPENLLESELFGYKEGAFTGASKKGKPGKFEIADKGTIFLDEISEMSPQMQAKILRVLQEKEIDRLGADEPIKIDVRVVAASNRNLEEMVEKNEFREDLYYRLNVVSLNIPPLRERREDIPLLANKLLSKISYRMGIPYKSLDSEALDYLISHDWPGNVRELENVLERALNIVEGHIITVDSIAPHLHKKEVHISEEQSQLKEAVEQLERTMILNALKASSGNNLEAARKLGVSKSTFYEKIKKYNIT